MMMKIFFLPFFLFASLLSAAQNLVMNPSFEEGLPEKVIQKRNEKIQSGQSILSHWISPTAASPDVYNSPSSSCNGIPVAHARSGKGLAGLVLAERKSLSSFLMELTKNTSPEPCSLLLKKGKPMR